jgi:hypothetical protein
VHFACGPQIARVGTNYRLTFRVFAAALAKKKVSEHFFFSDLVVLNHRF